MDTSQLPLCIKECTDLQLKHDAIAAFTRGTDEAREKYFKACLVLYLDNKRAKDQANRHTKFKEWKSLVDNDFIINDV